MRTIVIDCHSLWFAIRLIIAIGVGQLITWLVVQKYLWPKLIREGENVPHLDHSPTEILGLVERLLYMTALMVGASQFVGVWLVVKAAVRWRQVKEDTEYGTGTDIIWLTGTGLNLLTAFVGAWFSLLKLPAFRG